MPVYPRKRLPYVTVSFRLLDKMRRDIPHMHVPFMALLKRTNNYHHPEHPKWLMWTPDGELTTPRVGSRLYTMNQLVRMKKLYAVKENANYIDIRGQGKGKKKRKAFVNHWGALTGRGDKTYDVNLCGSEGIMAEVKGEKIGARIRIMHDEKRGKDLITIEKLKDGMTIDSEIYREE